MSEETKNEDVKNDYAVIRYAGKDYQVSEGERLTLPLHIESNEQQEVVFNEVLLLKSGESSVVGTPLVEGAKVTARILGNRSDKKIIVFKKKRRQGYRKKQGHRAPLCDVVIESFIASA